MTPRSDIAAFLEMVRPVATEHPLIRIGGNDDGGYLIPDDLEGVRYCFSPGVSAIADFEAELVERGIGCFLADYSVASPPSAATGEGFHFEKKFLGGRNDDVFTTLDAWITRQSLEDGDMILQMDIEGSEYDVFFEADSALLRKFRIIVVEFHDICKIRNLFFCKTLMRTFGKLTTDFDVVHIHVNNIGAVDRIYDFDIPNLIEVTFLRKDRSTVRAPATVFPHPLDRGNVADRSDVALPACWRG
jgi:hypothetical protein